MQPNEEPLNPLEGPPRCQCQGGSLAGSPAKEAVSFISPSRCLSTRCHLKPAVEIVREIELLGDLDKPGTRQTKGNKTVTKSKGGMRESKNVSSLFEFSSCLGLRKEQGGVSENAPFFSSFPSSIYFNPANFY